MNDDIFNADYLPTELPDGHVESEMPCGVNYDAVRAFNRVWAPRARMHAIAADADAGFDGGEWSAGWHCQMAQDEEDVILEKVGARFGLTATELSAMCFFAAHYEQDRFMANILERGDL